MTLPPLVAGNWKMNGLTASLAEVRAIRDGVAAGSTGHAEIVICPPATLLMAAADACRGSTIGLGGQDCHAEDSGAFTGDISASMLRDAGATYVILGHSERREGHGETDAAIKRKAEAALAVGLKVIVCVGETRQARETGRAVDIVASQLDGSLSARADAACLVVAYEPIWAIGTGTVPTPAEVAEMHAASLLGVADVDGALVGGASLKATDFLAIAAAYRRG